MSHKFHEELAAKLVLWICETVVQDFIPFGVHGFEDGEVDVLANLRTIKDHILRNCQKLEGTSRDLKGLFYSIELNGDCFISPGRSVF